MESLEELKSLKKDLTKKLKKLNRNNKRQLIIKNKSVVVTVFKHVAPVVLSTTLVSAGLWANGCGVPFILDTDKEIRVDTLEYSSNGYANYDFHYVLATFLGHAVEDSTVTIYSPYEYDGENYIRFKKTFSIIGIKDFTFNEINEYLINKDVNFFINNFELINSVEEKVNMLPKDYENDYYIEAYVSIDNEENSLYTKESVRKNVIITACDLVIGIWIATAFKGKDKRTMIDDLDDVENLYRENLLPTDDLVKELESVNNKIKSLKGAKSYEK